MRVTTTVRLDDTIQDELENFTASTHHSRSFLVAEAFKAYIKNHQWYIAQDNP